MLPANMMEMMLTPRRQNRSGVDILNQKKFHMPTAYTILFLLLILVAAATWIIPAGSYDYVDGVPVAGTYHTVEQNPQGVGDVLKAAFSGFYDAVDVCIFILMVGGFLGVVMKTGAVDAGVGNVIRLLGGREKWLIPILMLLFGLGGTTYGMWEETMAFYPLLIPVFLAAGYDAVVGISVILLGAGAGVIASTVNPFATGIAAGFAGVSLGEGIVLRLLEWVAFEAAAIWFVMAYAAKVKKNPSKSVVGVGAGKIQVSMDQQVPFTAKRKVIMALFTLTFLIMVYAVVPFDEMGLSLPALGWWFPELSALFLVAGVVIGLIDRMSEEELVETYVAGCADLLGVAFIIGISRGITVLMNDGAITDTVLHWGEQALSGAGAISFTLLVFALYLPLTILIPSSSGLATLSIPIVAPLGKFAGVGGDLVVTAFQSASGLYAVVPFDEMGLSLPALGWWFPELSALFLVAGVVIGLIDRMSEEELVETYVAGCADLLGVAFIIGISRGITVLMNDGAITDTVLHWGEQALSGAGAISFTLLVFALYLPLTILIPSSSGLATLSIPIVAPLGKFAGVGGDLVVTAFQSASGLVNIITPTAAVVMGALALGHVPYDRWVKYVWKLILWFLLLALAFLVAGVLLG